MKTRERKQQKAAPAPVMPMPCEDIQGLLFDYMSRELGAARAALVREHLRKCAGCRRAAAEIQRTLDALKEASQLPAGAAERLTAERRARLMRAVMHPILNWIYTHHVLVSLTVALLALLLGLLFVEHLRLRRDDASDAGPPVIIAPPPSSTGNIDRAGQ